MRRYVKHLLLTSSCLFALTASPARAALLEGERIAVRRNYQAVQGGPLRFIEEFNVFPGPGVELPSFGGSAEPPPIDPIVSIDISDTNVLITLLVDQPFAFTDVLSFIDIAQEIVTIKRVDLNPATNWAGFNDGRIISVGNLFEVTLSQMSSGLAGQQLSLDLVPFPEPASGTLLGVAVTSLAAVHRRRRASGAAARAATQCR